MLTLIPGVFLLPLQMRADGCRPSVAINPVNSLFTVYQARTAIVLRAGCHKYLNGRVICTCQSYEAAQRFARLAAQMNGLPIIDRVVSSRMQRQV